MKKNHLIILLLSCVAFSFSACQKCTVCTHVDTISGELTSDEYCGSSKSVTDYEQQWAEDWAMYGGYCARN